MNPDRWRRIKEIYNAALDLQPSRRDAYVEEACAGDESLLMEVKTLLDSRSDIGDSLEERAIGFVAKALVEDRAGRTTEDLIGCSVSHYLIVEKIGQGGMGEVFLADDKSLGRKVALKFLPPHLQQDTAAHKRFIREAHSAAALNHPNICSIYEVGNSGGKDFIGMEYVDGQTLRDRLAKGPLPLLEAVRIALEVAEALEEAHEKSIIHRDLKPANIMLTRKGHAKVMDFGLAKQLIPPGEIESQEESLTLTRSGMTPGTLAYMSPEQLRGECLDARSDMFAFGIVLYEMISGIHPFKKATGLDTASAILKDMPQHLGELRPDAPVLLQHIVEKMLAKDPNDRFSSIHDVTIDLKELLEKPDQPLDEKRRPRKTRRRSLVLRAGAVILTLGVVVGGGIWYLAYQETKPIESIAVLPLENLSGDPQQEYFADGMTESLITDLSRLTGLKTVIARGSVMRYKKTQRPIADIAKELGVDALITGAVARSGKQMRLTAQLVDPQTGRQLWTEHYERNLGDVMILQKELTSVIAGEIRVKLTAKERQALGKVRGIDPEAYDAYLMGLHHIYTFSANDMDKALGYFQDAAEKDPAFTPARLGIAAVWSLRDYLSLVPKGEGYAKSAPIIKKVLEKDDSSDEAHELLGTYLTWGAWQWEPGVREFKKAIEINPSNARARYFYSLTLHAMRRAAEARGQMERAIELDPYNPTFHSCLALELISEGRPDEGLVELEKTATLDARDPRIYWLRWEVHERKAEFTEAIAQASEYFARLGRSDLVRTVQDGYAGADYRVAIIRLADALSAELDGAGRWEAIVAIRNPVRIACLYAAAGQDDRALDLLERACQRGFGPLPYANAWKQLEHLRGNPRFQELLRRMNLPQ
ncbi:MAG: hypothetical protein EHM23_08985 [Acidobacteria bacterium]|nr:MAG: hypothetical protein EHM23_08985 [Acidobacteriota bacterium]